MKDIPNIEEYNLLKQLNKIGNFFKFLFYLIIFSIALYLIYIFTFTLDKVTPIGEKNQYKKAIINISFQSKKDFKKSQFFLKEYQEILYNRSNSKIEIPKFTPIYLNKIKNKGSLFSLKPKFNNSILYEKNNFYFFKHYLDNDAYKRGEIFTPKLEELYSGKVIFGSFFETSYLDLINLVAGIMLSDDLYSYKYSEQIKYVVIKTLKNRKTFLISSYNNKDHTTHKNLLKAYSTYFKGKDLISSLKTGNYYLANELIADARYFKYEINKKSFKYDINFKEKKFIILFFKDGNLINKINKLHFETELTKGFYNIVILKKEDTLFGEKELFWIYLNFNI